MKNSLKTCDRIVRESLFEFHKTGDPLGSLGLGARELNSAHARELIDNGVENDIDNKYQYPRSRILFWIINEVAEGETFMNAFNRNLKEGVYYGMLKSDHDKHAVEFSILTILKEKFNFIIDEEEYRRIGKKLKVFEFHKTGDPLTSLGLGPYAQAVYDIFDGLGIPREDYRIEGNKTVFAGSLDFNDCAELTELPSFLYIMGYLYLTNCTNLTELPRNLHVKGHLDLRGCTKIIKLPNDLYVRNKIWLNSDQIILTEFIRRSKWSYKLLL